MTIKEQAQDLIFEAIELPDDDGYQLALKALQMDSDCIEAYEYLGSLEPIFETAILYYKNGIEISKTHLFKNSFQGWDWKFLDDSRDKTIYEMHASSCKLLAHMGKFHDAISIYEEMIRLTQTIIKG